MQAPVQTIHIDRAHKLVDVHIAGFVTPEDAGWLGEDVRAAIRSLGSGVGEHVTLYDVTDIGVAPMETIEMLKEMFAHPTVRAMWARKVAFVTTLALGRIQMRRLRAVRGDIAVFAERAEALAWLLGDQPDRA